ncbi:hypothetical protein [Paenibacillus uliginis]|nr:hypothetical protein [Paenibacillus uliginis]
MNKNYAQRLEFVDKKRSRIENKPFFCYDDITFGCEYVNEPSILSTGCG